MTIAAETLVLFGATGDLSQRMLLPSLFGLHRDGLVPPDLRIIGTARSGEDDAGFRAMAGQALARTVPAEQRDAIPGFLDRLSYVPLDLQDAHSFGALSTALGDRADRPLAIFLSTAPALFQPAITGLAGQGLAGGNARLALEKPLGHDLASSQAINDAVAAVFPEERIFRIDHYLGKETVQNLIALRFANSLFEPMWNAGGLEHVQISVAETVGLEGRVGFYDDAGALRDMVQNHMLQLLALVAMEPPARFDATSVRDEKVKVLRSLRPIDRATAQSHSVIGQYRAGAIAGRAVAGYADELGRPSATETFVAIKAHVDNWRWRGVPFYLRTGKRLPDRQTEENIRLLVMAKQPGLGREGVVLREIPLDISLPDAFTGTRRRIAYERLLLDLIEGDPTLFVRRDEVEAQWRWIDAIRRGLEAAQMTPALYTAGSWGPSAAIALAERNGASWHE
jgi:glucose-6-phosphate 1-dehydrogenase